ncbi:DNA polymerase subunit gamma-1, mitochondrial [Condylostylus longicornis]|uniref:DNA polymerase subunit gamma-1, mitochondrial n=1 Tax=Condylostylus longicornis TaxID=2530218 RepID=UPI00244E122B|nr:DNA polymerase subunit gamma-1, mitochondrial [Condylostylus longicornis]
MRIIYRHCCKSMLKDFTPHSTVRIFKNNVQKLKNSEMNEYRENEMKIQMISRNLFNQIFKNEHSPKIDETIVKRCLQEIKKFDIDIENSPKLEDVYLKLPKLKGQSIEEHFYQIAREQSDPYLLLTENLLVDIPDRPRKWNFECGWTKYSQNGTFELVDYPDENALILDVEVCMSVGLGPTIACAVGKNHWYSWLSEDLITRGQVNANNLESKKYFFKDLIPLGNVMPKLIIGHNVSYDRARISEQYLIEDTKVRFLDTMSLHVCVSGITSYQRSMLKSKQTLDEEDNIWSSQSSLNSLKEVYKLYCKKDLQKEEREIFVKGTLNDVWENLETLINYCSSDVVATQDVFRQLFPLFKNRFPHPVTLAGMLEIGSAYLPVNENWNRYIEEADLTYMDLDIEGKYHLEKRANEACQLMHNKDYEKDLWMWDQDWSTTTLKMKKGTKNLREMQSANTLKSKSENIDHQNTTEIKDESVEEDLLAQKFQYLYDQKVNIPVRRPLLVGYPNWYRKLCSKPNAPDWLPGPNNIGTGMQIVPKLLSLSWEGYPLHYIKDHGWGFLVPFQEKHSDTESGKIPIEQLIQKCPLIETDLVASERESLYAFDSLTKDVEHNISKRDYYKKKVKKDKTYGKYTGTGVWCNTVLEGVCWFFKLPHKNGPSFRVGNPMAKDFLNKFSENVLTGDGSNTAERVIEIAKMLSYWRNNRDRIQNQFVVWIPHNKLPYHLKSSKTEYGAIIPQVVVCGTLTRRAMEPTWMTASNAQSNRVGSELRAMVQSPIGYRIVGADVDSQELWIASVLGDASAYKMHGATPLGWMTISGTKSDGTDMHSVTAKAIGISRDHAKIINYARIYGAGQNFAERLLKQFNPAISDSEAKSKAQKMFTLTKGKKVYELKDEFQNIAYKSKMLSGYEALKMAAASNTSVPEMFKKPKWENGIESAMFNRLEEIAGSKDPVTPFLNCRLSRALQPQFEEGEANDDRFLPTRVNWVVQSGAVDFLHLMLVSMRWLMGNNLRFCLSFHDEVRYLVKENLVYRAALALHVTNLLTRSFCASRIGLNDLPQSIAFFSSVEVDRALRKESNADCKTPSNPHGLKDGYGIPKGESLDIYKAIEKCGSNDISKWSWLRDKRKL